MNTEWKLVPVEPVDEQQLAGAQAIRMDTTPLNKMFTANRVYREMIAAAPPAPTSHPIPTGATGEDDIVQRLRDNADLDAAEDGNPAVIRLEREAAKEIERLRRALADAPAAGDALDKARLDWLEQHDGRFYNKDRISSIVGVGFLIAGDLTGMRHQSVRAAIDAAIAQQSQRKEA